MDHCCEHECKHEQVKFCQGCKTVYCVGCKQKWVAPCNLQHYPYTWLTTGGTYTTTGAAGMPVGSNPEITWSVPSTFICGHG